MKVIKTLLVWWVLIPLLPVWAGDEVKPLKFFSLSQADGIIIEKANSFIVTGDDRVMVADSKAANIKIFDITGKRIKVFGGKGMGPHEFVRPRRIVFKEPFMAIVDFGRKSIFIYKLLDGGRFEFVTQFLCLYLGYDFKLIDGEKIMVAGVKIDEKERWYSLYQHNFKEKKYDLILPAESAYGFTSFQKYQKEKDETIDYIGQHLYFDVCGDDIYLVWKGDLNVLKINRKTRKIVRFGNKTKRFVKPYVTPEIRRAFQLRDHRLIWELDRPMSSVKYIFVTKADKVGVVYIGPFRDDGTAPVMLQFYSSKGEFFSEHEILKAKASHHNEIYFYFRKSDSRFYVLDTETFKDFDQSYKIHEYQIAE